KALRLATRLPFESTWRSSRRGLSSGSCLRPSVLKRRGDKALPFGPRARDLDAPRKLRTKLPFESREQLVGERGRERLRMGHIKSHPVALFESHQDTCPKEAPLIPRQQRRGICSSGQVDKFTARRGLHASNL